MSSAGKGARPSLEAAPEGFFFLYWHRRGRCQRSWSVKLAWKRVAGLGMSQTQQDTSKPSQLPTPSISPSLCSITNRGPEPPRESEELGTLQGSAGQGIWLGRETPSESVLAPGKSGMQYGLGWRPGSSKPLPLHMMPCPVLPSGIVLLFLIIFPIPAGMIQLSSRMMGKFPDPLVKSKR